MADEYKPNKPTIPVLLYGVGIHNAAASGNLSDMKKIAAEAEAYLSSHGDVSAALQTLKIAIAKLEGKK
ncbi:MAG: DUF1843 domain-containing protein [Bryobacteraceae bacterium]